MFVALLLLAIIATAFGSDELDKLYEVNSTDTFNDYDWNSTDFDNSNNNNQLNELGKLTENYIKGISKTANWKYIRGRYYLQFHTQRRAQNLQIPVVYRDLYHDPISSNSYISMLAEPSSVQMMRMPGAKIPIVLLLLFGKPNYSHVNTAKDWAMEIAQGGFYVFTPDLIGAEKIEYDQDRLGELQRRIEFGFYAMVKSVSVFAPKPPDVDKVVAFGLGDFGGLAALDMARTQLLGVKGVVNAFGTDFSRPIYSKAFSSNLKILTIAGGDGSTKAVIRQFQDELSSNGVDWQTRIVGELNKGDDYLTRNSRLIKQFCHEIFD